MQRELSCYQLIDQDSVLQFHYFLAMYTFDYNEKRNYSLFVLDTEMIY